MNVTELPIPERTADIGRLAEAEAEELVPGQVETLIHTRTALDRSVAEYAVEKLEHLTGVSGARYSPARDHLLIVRYNPGTIESAQLLAVMRELGHEAQLVGL